MRKTLSILLIAILVMSLVTTNVFGVEAIEGTKIKMHDVYVTVPYDEGDIDVVYEVSDYEVIVTIKDAVTGKTLESHGEYIPTLQEMPDELLDELPIEIKNKALAARSNGEEVSPMAGGYFNKLIFERCEKEPVVARLYCDFEYFYESNHRNLISIIDTFWAEESSGSWEIENEYSNARIVDPINLVVYGVAGIVITTTKTTTGEFSIGFLESLGYSISHSSGSNYHARELIDDFSYSYSLY